MKTAICRILTFSIGIWVFASANLPAQQTYIDKRYYNATAPKTLYVAQQQQSAPQTAETAGGIASSPYSRSGAIAPQASQSTNATPASQYVMQSDQSYSAPGAIISQPASPDQNAYNMPQNMDVVDNGLWDGCDFGNCCSICGGGYCTPPLWYTMQGTRIISRSAPQMTGLGNIFTTATSSSGQTVIIPEYILNTKSVSYDVAAGYYATIGRYLGRDSQDRDDFLELTYWGMNTWVTSQYAAAGRVTDNYWGHPVTYGTLQSPFLTNEYIVSGTIVNGFGAGGFNQTDRQTLTVNSEIHNWELNLRLSPRGRPDQLVLQPNGRWMRECQPGTFMSYLVGLRYMTFGDGAIWHGEGTIVDNGVSSFITGDYDIRTENDLLGLQIGADLTFRRCKWSWGVRSKIGPYINFARDVQDIKNNPAGDPFNSMFLDSRLTAKQQKVALIGEVGFEATYKFKPNLMGRAAYDFMWISGLALAGEQFQFSPTPIADIHTNGSLFSQGVTLALEWLW